MSAVTAPADKRFRRAHVKPMRRRKWRSAAVQAAKYAGLALAVTFAIYRGAAVVAHARVLQIDRIIVHGNGRLSSGEVLAVLDGLRGQNLMWTNLDGWRNRLLASPWVKDASLRRSLPSTIEVTVSERSPIALGRMRDGLYLIDDRGQVIDQYGPQYADLDLPIVDGLVSAKPDDEEGADEGRADLAARFLTAVNSKPALAKRVSQLDVSDLHNAAVILTGDPAVIYVGDDRFLPRLESYEQLAAALRERVPDIDYVDLRFDDRIYVRPASAPKGAAAGKPANRG
jgi:cell division septal protein FtsQ